MNVRTPEQIRTLLSSRRLSEHPRVVVSGNQAVPRTLLALLDETLPSYRLNTINAPKGLPDREGVIYETSFVGAGMRAHPRLRYVPARLSQVPLLFSTTRQPDVVLVHTSMPRGGKVSLGIEINVLPAAIEACHARGGLIIAQMNPQMPYTYGDGEYGLHLFDAVIEVDEPLPTPPPRRTGGDAADSALQIGELVAARVPNGATLQLGIGEVPDATLASLVTRRDLALWSEMFSDGLLRLDEAGALDPERTIVSSFAFGSEALYRWLDGNRRVQMRRTEITNDPAHIARQPLMTSVNTALQVDLFGQANASRIGARIHSGFGGQTDFIVGALHARGGQALMALRSWHPKAQVSTLVPILREPTTSFQPSAVITEQGVAVVQGLDERAQAAAIIEQASHPDARDGLRTAAAELGLS